MRTNKTGRAFASALAVMMAVFPLATLGQTQISMPKNKYKVQDDIRIGSEAARQVDQQFPIMNDGLAQNYVSRIGQRLVAAIPSAFQQPAFSYSFKVVNASDLNAFALPGGPMYVNRGMIELAKNEGEIAGVMAHEISHVALRHATAQQTKLNNPLNQILGIGAVLGGAVLGGQAGAQAGQVFAQGYFLRYSREYETQADILGARIMAAAGYDPRDLANVFRTIEQQGGSGTPEWLSSHPNPGNRYQKINAEAAALNVSPDPLKITRDFRVVQERFRSMPPARSMAQIQSDVQNGRGGYQNQYPSQSPNPTSGGNYSSRVEYPSPQMRVFRSGSWLQMSIPDNWQQFPGTNSVDFAPEGGYGDQGITHGAMVGVVRPNNNSYGGQQFMQSYIDGLIQSNNYLRQQNSLTRTTFAGRGGYTTVLSGRSPVTGRSEIVTVYLTQLTNGDMFYVATVVPLNEASNYTGAFRNLLNSIRLNG